MIYIPNYAEIDRSRIAIRCEAEQSLTPYNPNPTVREVRVLNGVNGRLPHSDRNGQTRLDRYLLKERGRGRLPDTFGMSAQDIRRGYLYPIRSK